MSKSPVYIGAGSNELAVQAALNLIQDGIDSATHLVTVADWVHLTDGTTVIDRITEIDSLKYSAKEYAQGDNADTGGSAKDYAQYTGGAVRGDTDDYSAKSWATGGTGVTNAPGRGSAKDWATGTGRVDDPSAGGYSAKEHATGTTVAEGSAKEWATNAGSAEVATSAGYSSKAYAQDTGNDIGSSKDWAVLATQVSSTDYSSKQYAVGTPPDGSAKEWATTDTVAVTGSLFSAKQYAANSAASASSASNDLATFQGIFRGASTSTPGSPTDGDLWFDTNTNVDVMKVYNSTASAWEQLTPTAANQTNINTVAADGVDIGKVAAIDDKVEDVAAIDDKVTTVANITSGHISLVAAIDDKVELVGTNIASVNTVATDIVKVVKVADDLLESVSEIETVAADLLETTSEIDTVAGSIVNVDLVGGDIANVNTVSTNIANVNKVAVIDANVTKVAVIDSNVTKVADIDGNVTKVADIDGNVTKVANIDGNVTKVADVDGEVVLVAAVDGEVALVSAVDTEVGRLGVAIHTTATTGNLARLGTAAMATASTGHLALLGTAPMANTTNGYLKVLGNATVTDDMALLGATGVIGDIEIVSNNISDVNNFADQYQISAFAPAPALDGGGNSLAEGDLAFDTRVGEKGLKVWTGSAWSGGINTTEGVIVKHEYTGNGTERYYVLAHDQDMEIVYLNGVKQLSGDGSDSKDYISVNGGSSTAYAGDGDTATHIYFTVAPSTNDVISVVAWGASNNSLAVPIGGGAFTGAVTLPAGSIINGTEIVTPNATTTDSNLGIGIDAVSSITTGVFNIGFGDFALKATTEGDGNHAFGLNALEENISGNYNSAFGYKALTDNETGDYNCAFGSDALRSSTVSKNNAFGYEALRMNNTGTENSAFGYKALRSNTTGIKNSAFGYFALNLSTGGSNIAIGYKAGDNITSGSSNIIIGSDIDADSATGSNQLNIGGAIKGDLSTNAITFPGNVTLSGGWTAASQTCANLGTVTTGAFTTITNLGNVTTTGTVGLGGKLTAGSNEIEGSNFDINGGDISGVTISSGLTWSASQDMNSRNLSNVQIVSGTIGGTVIGAGGSTAAAGTFTTCDATTDFTIGGLVITDGQIADTGTLALVPVFGCTLELGNDAGEDFNVGPDKFIVSGDNGGRVGITTGDPQAKFHIKSGLEGASDIVFLISDFNNDATTYAMLIKDEESPGFDDVFHLKSGGSGAGADLNMYIRGGIEATGTLNGCRILENADSGIGNILIGLDALGSLASGGVGHTAVGVGALQYVTTIDYNTAVGYACFGRTTSGHNTGVGAMAGFRNTGNCNTFVGSSAGYSHVSTNDGGWNTAVGVDALENLQDGWNNLCLGGSAGTSTSPSGNIQGDSNIICLGDEDIDYFFVEPSSFSSSDGRDKTDVEDFTVGLDWIESMRPITYKWDKRSWYTERDKETREIISQSEPDGTRKKDKKYIGFIAQEVLEIEKTHGFANDKDDMLTVMLNMDDTKYSMSYERLVPVLVNAIKELSAKVKALEAGE